MRSVSRAICTLAEPVSDSFSPKRFTISPFASFVRGIQFLPLLAMPRIPARRRKRLERPRSWSCERLSVRVLLGRRVGRGRRNVVPRYGGLERSGDRVSDLARNRHALASFLPCRDGTVAVSYTHLRAHETRHDLVCRLLLEKKKKK